ncbi:thermonuclease family protein [Mesorhizobium sp. VK4C]|uniref:thermonuclease family protein n=1 Tax=Mesorhizobium captivum TaxID=3072319 RepID=UPI002A2444D3|nr:thermonuclease family protein [Mesorhizobium sp. VK4C]MDX8500710.1 thermonuclease family protein [Mesorhizobium sp. VK4C]
MRISTAGPVLLQLAIAAPCLAGGVTDVVGNKAQPARAATIAGGAAVIDGHTLWFPRQAVMVRLAGIDSCELAQWSFDPTAYGSRSVLKPVPCGALAKAWLKRAVSRRRVVCAIPVSPAGTGAVTGVCAAAGQDLALSMLRTGWARLKISDWRPGYLAAQSRARAARYGMWATYVLDADEWRRKAVDKTLARLPVADFNLLAERESEVSPPFDDARRLPARTDR